jgi:hypothetical protein
LHNYTNEYFYKNIVIGVNKCKLYISQMDYIGVNRWSTWKKRRLT